MYVRTLLLVYASLVLGTPARGSAQQIMPARVPVTLVMVNELPAADGAFRIERRTAQPGDVIFVRADATKDQLSDAVRSLLVVRQVAGDIPTQAATMRMRPRQTHAAFTRREFPWMPRVLADLRRAEPRDVPGLGHARALQIWLPPQHGGRRR